jgi:glycosyltransferase involved in cell wall biosynthesis
LKKDSPFKDVKLHVTGGYTADDKPFVNELMKKINSSGYGRDVKIFKNFDRENRVKFLKMLTLLSVPVPGGEAFGAYQVEALAAGVPVVQPKAGCFPEFVEATKGGVIYDPNNSETLSAAIASLLSVPYRVREMGSRGQKAVMEGFSMDNMARNIVQVYEEVLSKS